MAEEVVRLRIINSLTSDRNLVLEPWTGQYQLPAGKSLDILASGDLAELLTIEMSEEGIILHSFDSKGALLRVFRDGVEIERSE